MGYVVLGILALAMLFLLFMSFKTWKFFHLFVLFLVFAASAVLMIYAALVLKARVAWKEVVEKRVSLASVRDAPFEQQFAYLQEQGAGLEQQLELLQRWKRQIVDGNLVATEQAEDSLKAVKYELRRQLDERGRVWRECQVTKLDARSIELNTAPPGPNQISVNAKLIAFKEDFVPEISNEFKVPVAYLGEFIVTAATDTTVTLQPTLTLDPQRDKDQIAQINDRSGTWVLYERMPLDRHDVFAGMDADQIRAALPKDKMGLSDEQYERMIDEYRFDGQPISKIKETIAAEPGRISTEFDPPPSQVWVQVKFTQPHDIDVNGEVGGGASLTQNPFDASGRAQVISLLQINPETGEPYPSHFEPGDTAIFDKDTADRLIATGKAELLEPIFVRELRDYEYLFRQHEIRRLALLTKIDAATRDVEDVKVAKAKAQSQITYREGEITRLKEDLANHQQELAMVTQYRQKLEQDWEAVKDRIRSLYYANKYYAAQLAEVHKRLMEQARQQSLAAQTP